MSETPSGFQIGIGRRRAERCAAGTLALVMTAGLIGLLILSRPPSARQPPLPRELVFILPRLVPTPETASPFARSAPFFAPAPVVRLPPAANAPFAAPLPQMRSVPETPDLSGIGQSMFGCAPETWSSLTPEQKAKCPRPGEGYAVLEAPDLMHPPNSHVKDEAHWQAEFAREKANLMVPCAGVMSTGSAVVPAIDPLCILAMLATGHGDELVDPHKWPHYQIEQMSAPDFAKIEQAYDAWNKAHTAKGNAQ